MHMSDALFSSLVAAPADPILGVTQRYRQDPRPQKVNLGVGATEPKSQVKAKKSV